jgi:prepilin-type processing-associated H-X9-DG protein
MKQYLIGLHNYHDTLSTLPASRCRVPRTTDPANHFNLSMSFVLFPFVEQQAAYDTTVYGYSTFSPVSIAASPAMNNVSFKTFGCPSDPYYGQCWTVSTATSISRCNIMFSAADTIQRNNYNANQWPNPTKGNSYSGVAAFDNASNRSPFSAFMWKNLGAMNDGTSNTIGISESATPKDTNDNAIRGGIISGSSDVHNYPKSNCMDRRDPSNPDYFKPATASIYPYSFRGARIDEGRLGYTGFCTVLPPNSPSCGVNSGDTANDGYGLMSATSYHSGGVNTGFLDGSVHFVQNGVDCGNVSAAPNYGGNSVYGVWGALGSINGGESNSLGQ